VTTGVASRAKRMTVGASLTAAARVAFAVSMESQGTYITKPGMAVISEISSRAWCVAPSGPTETAAVRVGDLHREPRVADRGAELVPVAAGGEDAVGADERDAVLEREARRDGRHVRLGDAATDEAALALRVVGLAVGLVEAAPCRSSR
jgi:hypothetical protein